MTEPAAARLGPAPFPFVPATAATHGGPAFSVAFKVMATLIVAGCGAGFLHAWQAGRAAGAPGGGGWFIA